MSQAVDNCEERIMPAAETVDGTLRKRFAVEYTGARSGEAGILTMISRFVWKARPLA